MDEFLHFNFLVFRVSPIFVGLLDTLNRSASCIFLTVLGHYIWSVDWWTEIVRIGIQSKNSTLSSLIAYETIY